MSKEYKSSELILNPDGSIYHLHLKKENVADKIILVGDPGRVKTISDLFDKVEFKVENREFVTHTGIYNGERLTAISTGIGTDNIDIVLNELDAIFNIDLKTHQKIENLKSLKLVRIGTTGGLQEELVPGSFVLSRYAAGFDGLMHFYRNGNSVSNELIEKAFVKHTNWSGKRAVPYFAKGDDELFNLLNEGVHSGITISAPGFYGPQGRQLRLPVIDSSLNEKISSFRFESLKITNFEMESSALFGLSTLLGHQAATICAVVANRISGKSITDHKPVIADLLKFTLDQLVS
ncbi:MAG: nucleoside phosphorylase [Bacteroidales bacterium]|nr:nucleoside phosphorylase [Bacteroidales bacterium]